MSDFHSELVGQYTNPMDPTGFGVSKSHEKNGHVA